MGLGLAMSGVSNTGHDIGGFSGPAPSPELLVRWVQHGIFLPRFSIHSWNDDQTVNEPWMYPAVTPQIRDLIVLRYRLIPYLYDLVWRYHTAYEPIIRPTYHDFPEDLRCLEENDDMLVGPNLLSAAVVEPGQTARRVWLPGTGGWYDWHTAQHYKAGQEVTLQAPLHGAPPLLAREGCAIPTNDGAVHFGKVEDVRGFQVFPLKGEGAFEATCFEDDGHSRIGSEKGVGQGQWKLTVNCTAQAVQISVVREGALALAQSSVQLRVPAADSRCVSVADATVLEDSVQGGWRYVSVQL